jgi:enediyne biosynthesis protein E4
MDGIFSKEMMQDALVLHCKEVRSGYFENDGRGHFSFHPFPPMAQIAPVNAMICTDVNADGKLDIILAGNEYQAQVMAGRYDASYGLLLTGDGKGNFNAVKPVVSGLIIDGDTKDLKMITAAGQKLLLAGVNNEKMKVFAIKK